MLKTQSVLKYVTLIIWKITFLWFYKLKLLLWISLHALLQNLCHQTNFIWWQRAYVAWNGEINGQKWVFHEYTYSKSYFEVTQILRTLFMIQNWRFHILFLLIFICMLSVDFERRFISFVIFCEFSYYSELRNTGQKAIQI